MATAGAKSSFRVAAEVLRRRGARETGPPSGCQIHGDPLFATVVRYALGRGWGAAPAGDVRSGAAPARFVWLSSDGAVCWVGLVGLPRRSVGDELHGDRFGFGRAVFAQRVFVVAAAVDESLPGGVGVAGAAAVLAGLVGHLSQDDEDEAGARVLVPAGGSSGIDLVVDRDEALVRSDGPRRRGGLVLWWVVRGRPTCVGQPLRSRQRAGDAAPERSGAARCYVNSGLRRDRTAGLGGSRPPEEMRCRRQVASARWPHGHDRALAQARGPRAGLSAHARVRGCRMLRPDVADVSRPRLME